MTDKSDQPEKSEKTGASRRRFLAGAAGLAVGAAARPVLADDANLPPNVAGWTKSLGEGVGARPYGNPSKHEKDVVRRTVEWLTATPESSASIRRPWVAVLATTLSTGPTSHWIRST